MSTARANIIRPIRLTMAFSIITAYSFAQAQPDTVKNDQKWNFHYQSTVVTQYHPSFSADYSGAHSLSSKEESATSISSTLYFGCRLWKGAEAYFNPELSGGGGFSSTVGVAGFPNGEVYRVSDPAPHIYIGRLYLRQVFALSKQLQWQDEKQNGLAGMAPTTFFAISAGRFSMMDFFDNNRYSHDPRTQFLNWTLMGNGAWDYAANTRGYTYGVVLELVNPQWAMRFTSMMMPKAANGAVMDPQIGKSRSEALELEHRYRLSDHAGAIRIVGFLNHARMGSYKDAISWGIARNAAPDIDSVGKAGNTKLGFGVNIEQELSPEVGLFMRAGWNDGKNETWAFTEVDQHVSVGANLSGNLWKRPNDNLGIAQIVNGISTDHRSYLKAAGIGFIIGDGNLSYRPECITEVYYSFKLQNYPFWLSPDYQLIVNPAYNRARGPVNAFGIRAHLEL